MHEATFAPSSSIFTVVTAYVCYEGDLPFVYCYCQSIMFEKFYTGILKLHLGELSSFHFFSSSQEVMNWWLVFVLSFLASSSSFISLVVHCHYVVIVTFVNIIPSCLRCCSWCWFDILPSFFGPLLWAFGFYFLKTVYFIWWSLSWVEILTLHLKDSGSGTHKL